MTHREAFMEAARAALVIIQEPAVAARWSEASACEGFTVGGLAEHLASQVTKVPEVLAAGAGDLPGNTLLGHYGRAAWVGADLDAEVNVGIREGGEALAVEGPQPLVARLREVVAQLPALLAAEPDGRFVGMPWVGWSLPLEDYLTTRMMEIAVHRDDLAVSVGLNVPDLPPGVFEPVLDLLARLASARHGQAAMLRALTRAERAPALVNAF